MILIFILCVILATLSHSSPSRLPSSSSPLSGITATTPSVFGSMDVFVINLEKRVDRLEHMTQLLKRLNVHNWTVVRPTPATQACGLLHDLGFHEANMKRFSANKCSVLHTYITLWQQQQKERQHASRTKGHDLQHYVILQDDIVEAMWDLTPNVIADILTRTTRATEHTVYHAIYLQPCADWCFMHQEHGGEYTTLYKPRCMGAAIFRADTAGLIPHMILSNETTGKGLDSLMTNHPDIVLLGTPVALFKQKFDLGTDLPHPSRFSRLMNQVRSCCGKKSNF